MPDDAPSRTVYLFGDPVSHSLSPLIHNAAFRAAGIDAAYRARHVAAGEVEAAVATCRAPHVLGANVTIPHKQAVMPHLDALTPRAEAIGAVNTIIHEPGGRLRGDNTDAAGFLYGLDRDALRGVPAVVFGAGGAARAVVYALLTEVRPETLTLVARRPAQAERLARDFAALDPGASLRAESFSEARAAVRTAGLLVNATPLGMHPNEESTPWAEVGDFHDGQTVYDLIYAPAETMWLRKAAAAGARTVGGMAMLIGQAAAAFEQWTGTPMPLDAVHAALSSQSQTGNGHDH